MTPRFAASFLVALSLSLANCATPHLGSICHFGLGDAQLSALGKELGFHVEARGVSGYCFFNEDRTFFITAHNDINLYRNGGPVADEPIIVFYRSKQLAIPISQGVTMSELEAKIRDFIETK